MVGEHDHTPRQHAAGPPPRRRMRYVGQNIVVVPVLHVLIGRLPVPIRTEKLGNNSQRVLIIVWT